MRSLGRTCTENDGVPCSVYIHIRNGTNTDHAHFCLCSLFKKEHKRNGTEHLIHLQFCDLGIHKVEMALAFIGDVEDK